MALTIRNPSVPVPVPVATRTVQLACPPVSPTIEAPVGPAAISSKFPALSPSTGREKVTPKTTSALLVGLASSRSIPWRKTGVTVGPATGKPTNCAPS